MVGDTALWEIIGADALVAHSRSYLTAAQTGDFAVQTLLLHFVELAGQHPHTFLPVLDLAPLLLTGDHDARGLVDQPHGGGGFVDVLTARAAGTVDLHFDVGGVDLHVHFLHLRQNRDGCGGGVDTAAGFRLGNPLDTVDAGFIFQSGIRAPAADDEVRLLDAAQLRFVQVHQLNAPAHFRGVHGVHPQQTVGKQGAFLAADAAADLHNDVLFVIGVFGKEQNLDFFGKGLLLRLGGGVGFLTKLLHFRVGHQLLSVRHVLLRLIVGVKGFHNGLQIVFFPEQPRRLLGVGVKIRLLGLGGKLFVFIADGL